MTMYYVGALEYFQSMELRKWKSGKIRIAHEGMRRAELRER